MKEMRTAIAGAFLVAATLVAACGGGGDAAQAEGIVRGVDRDNAQITLDHGDIPGLMKAMTMTFEVSDPAMLEGVEEGDNVEFHVRYAEGKYTVTAIDRR